MQESLQMDQMDCVVSSRRTEIKDLSFLIVNLSYISSCEKYAEKSINWDIFHCMRY